jgi:hypothetical protein
MIFCRRAERIPRRLARIQYFHTVPKVLALADDVERFILNRIPSVPYLEAALFFQSAPLIPRSAEGVAEALYLSQSTAQRLLQALCDGGVLAREGQIYRYAPKSSLRKPLDRVAEAYRTNLIQVTQLIHDATHKDARRFPESPKQKRDI